MFNVALYVQVLNCSYSFTHTLSCHDLNEEEVFELHYMYNINKATNSTVLSLINFSELSEHYNIQLLRFNLYAHFK